MYTYIYRDDSGGCGDRILVDSIAGVHFGLSGGMYPCQLHEPIISSRLL